MPKIELDIKEKSINVIDLISMTNIVSSKSEIRRLLQQNGFEINGNKVNLDTMINTEDNKILIIKKGKKTFLKVIIK